jgi:hypothetical protein
MRGRKGEGEKKDKRNEKIKNIIYEKTDNHCFTIRFNGCSYLQPKEDSELA